MVRHRSKMMTNIAEEQQKQTKNNRAKVSALWNPTWHESTRRTKVTLADSEYSVLYKNYLRAGSPRPTQFLSLLSKNVWSTVSKSVLKFSKMTIVSLPKSVLMKINLLHSEKCCVCTVILSFQQNYKSSAEVVQTVAGQGLLLMILKTKSCAFLRQLNWRNKVLTLYQWR